VKSNFPFYYSLPTRDLVSVLWTKFPVGESWKTFWSWTK